MASSLIAVPALTKVLLQTFLVGFTSGETIRRMRGTFVTVGTSGFYYHGAVGAFIANDTAIVAGVGSLLDPVTDVGDDAWLWYHSFHGGPSTAGEPGSAGQGGGQVVEIDSKAMRRLDNGYTLAIVVANSSATQTFSIALLVRVLGSEAS